MATFCTNYYRYRLFLDSAQAVMSRALHHVFFSTVSQDSVMRLPVTCKRIAFDQSGRH